MKKNFTVFIVLSLLIGFNAQSQIFTLNGGYQNFNAQEGGTPNLGNGSVQVRKAPAATGNILQIQRTLNQATIPDVVINSRLTRGALAGYIAQMPAVISMANKLNARPNTRGTGGAIVINSTNALNSNRNRIGNNATETYVFQGTVNVNAPIVVGSNKTIWIDGRVVYTGPERPLANTDALSPIPVIRDGLFRIQGKTRVSINGTKRGLVDCKTRIPFAYSRNSNRITIKGNEVINGFNTIFIHESQIVNVEDNFFYNSVRRGMHILAVNNIQIKNNLVFANHLDGIDIDAFCQNANVQFNVVLGATHRFMLWTEIDAHDNVMDNNVAIHLDGRKGNGSGGLQENGTEESRRGVPPFQGSRNNTWKHNHVFYPEKATDGIVMRKDRFIQHNTITFNNNYVWTVEGNGRRHNPKPQGNITNDVRFLTIQNPANGTKPNPTDNYPNGLPTFFSTAPGNLSGAQIAVTPNLFGGGGGTPPTGGGGSVVTLRKGTLNFGLDGNSGGANGQNVYIWSRNTSNVNQQWEEIDRGGGFYSYQKKNTNFCLDGGNGGANGQNVYLWTRNDSNQNQHWRKVPVAGGRFRLEKRNAPGFSIDAGNGGANRQNVYLWASNNNNVNQQWEFGSVSANARVSLADLGSTTNNLIDIKVYPNPLKNSETLYVDTDATKVKLQLVDLAGRVIHSTNQKSINFGTINMARGIYLLQINADDIQMVEKIAIE